MQTLLDKLAEADVWIFATPVYVDGMTGPLKNLIDRTVPLMSAYFELREGHCRKVMRESAHSGKVALVSSCGFWEMDNFDPLVAHVKAICRNMNREFAGALLRPHSRSIALMADKREAVNDIFAAAREAGKELVLKGTMSSRTLAVVSRTLLPLDAYVQAVNERFRQLLEELNR